MIVSGEAENARACDIEGMEGAEGRALLQCVRGALKAYRDPKIWRTIQANGMAKDFSWKASAAAYVTLYEAAKRSRIPQGISTSNRR